jgi:choice-of-anchor C domain-containing protein
MKFVPKSLMVASLALAFFSFSAPAEADLILNGSFEDGVNPGQFKTLSALDNTSIPGWSVDVGSVDYIGSYWNASDGYRSLDMDGLAPATISQSNIPTVIGQTYQVLFDISGNPDGPPTTKTLQILASVNAGSNIYTYTLPGGINGNHSLQWVTEAFVFTANTTLTTLSFTSLDNNPNSQTAFGPALDNVRMNAVPEATTLVTWSLLAVCVGARPWRRKRPA